MTRNKILAAGAAALLLLGATGCSQKYAAERDGKKLGEAICDLRDATSTEEAQAAVDEINAQLDDLGNKYATYTAEDRADIENNLADLAEHQVQGNELLMQQDLVVLERSIDNITQDVNETRAAAWEGVQQGLAECTQ